ncbi:MAG: 50S ribosomal protein L11 methyltransferase [Clostridia bacterium]
MKWLEICIESDTDNTELASYFLMEAGAAGTSIQSPDEIRSLVENAGAKELVEAGDFSKFMDKFRTTAYFSTETNINDLKGALKKRFADSEILWREADDSEWEGSWKKFYKAFNITPSLRITPSWDENAKVSENSIIMDPGMAFGTGTHESTKLCAGLVEKHMAKGGSMLDIGTGTGILSIIASKCGAKSAVALDIDPAAVKTAIQNLEINQIDNVIVYQGELRDVREIFKKQNFRAPFKFDLIAANIISDVIISLSDEMLDALNVGGKLVCSGIIVEREADVVAALEKSGFEMDEILHDNEWSAICAHA